MYVDLLIENKTGCFILDWMKKIFKLYTASILSVSLGVATVLCCCIAPTVMALFHRTTVCSHCHGQDPQGKPPNPAQACQQQLTSADFLHPPTISSPVVTGHFVPWTAFVNIHRLIPTHSPLLAYPPGGPPPGIGFTPLYLRTFDLRV